MAEVDSVLALIRDTGLHQLGDLEGCVCCSFNVRNIAVEVSCGKGTPRGIRVWHDEVTRDGISKEDADEAFLRSVGEEVARQAETDRRGEMPISIGQP